MSYFDHNATTPLSEAARAAWLRAVDESWQNPSSLHRAGARVRVRLDAARAQLAQVLDSVPERLVFTSGATEAATAVAQHLVDHLPPAARVAVNPTEHPAVLDALRARFGPARLHWLPLTREGVVTPEAVRVALASRTESGAAVAAVVVMAANNETGVLQPWPEIAAVCRAASVTSVCDASQWLGKLPGGGFGAVDWVFGSAHKFGGPKGVGFVQRAADAGGFVIQRGGGQERGHRGGTENYPGIAAMVAALVDAEQTQVLHETERLRWRGDFERDLVASLPGASVVAAGAERLWNTVLLLMPHGENTRWVARLDQRGFEVSTGSACASGKEAPSHVLAALGVTPEQARRALRVSSGWSTTPADWVSLRDALVAVAAEVKPSANVVTV